MYTSSDAGRVQAELVLGRLADDQALAEQFDTALVAFEASEQATQRTQAAIGSTAIRLSSN